MSEKILVNRELIDLGDGHCSTNDDFIRRIAKIPDDHDLWRRADYQHREYLKGPMLHDEKVEAGQRVYLAPNMTTAFFTAQKIIGNGAHRG